MKLHLHRAEGRYLISAVGEGSVSVNGEAWQQPLLVRPEAPPEALSAASFEEMAPAHFDALLAERPDVVLVGTGVRQRFGHPSLHAALSAAGIGVDFMTTAAACRTYNILVSEDRKVVALLFHD